MGESRDSPNFWSTPYYLRNGQSYERQILQIYSEGPCEQKPIKNFGENGAWAYTGTAQIFWVPPIISGTDKATNLKLSRYIHRVHANKRPLKIWENRERGRIQGLNHASGKTGVRERWTLPIVWLLTGLRDRSRPADLVRWIAAEVDRWIQYTRKHDRVTMNDDDVIFSYFRLCRFTLHIRYPRETII